MVHQSPASHDWSGTTLRILYLAAEADPLVKIGGLGDVAGSLPRALRKLSGSVQGNGTSLEVDIRLVLPLHGVIQHQALQARSEVTFDISYLDGSTHAEVLTTEIDGLTVYLITGPLIRPEAPVYSLDAGEDGVKYTFFSMAALEIARQLGWGPHILHANDWHTAPAIYALSRIRESDPIFRHTATVLGVHNLPYMGAGAGAALSDFGLPPAHGSSLPEWAQQLPLTLGLLTADQIIAVSPSYAREILTPEFGSGLSDFLQTRSDRICGILNGLDYASWNPATDPALNVNFDDSTIANRFANKAALQEEFGLPVEPKNPLIAMVTRMDPQKGIDLLPKVLRGLVKHPPAGNSPWQAIILGSGIPELESAIRQLEAKYPRHVRAAIRYDEGLSRRLYAGADIMLIPSRYEPSGLTQMIAMRYGCVPVARATGGLQDTIQDYSQRVNSTGFLFKKATSRALAAALRRALRLYASKTNAWHALQKRGMQRDYSWEQSARKYLDLYIRLATERYGL